MHGEGTAHGFLVLSQDVDAKGSGPGDARPAGGALGRSKDHHGWIQRESGKGLAGEPDGLPFIGRRHNGDASGEMAENLAEPGLIET